MPDMNGEKLSRGAGPFMFRVVANGGWRHKFC